MSVKHRMFTIVFLAFFVGGVSFSYAEEDERVNRLENEIKTLRGQIDQLSQVQIQPKSSGLLLPTLKIFGFGHVQYEVQNNGNKFVLGDFDLFLTSKILVTIIEVSP
ncbi:MAG: hypothetical protein O6857_07645 [Nitrospinae bacterium]|nr:hypothetical protein [Nitrospinota bacterium]